MHTKHKETLNWSKLWENRLKKRKPLCGSAQACGGRSGEKKISSDGKTVLLYTKVMIGLPKGQEGLLIGGSLVWMQPKMARGKNCSLMLQGGEAYKNLHSVL